MSSAADPTAAFFANLRASGVLPQAQLQELWAWIGANRPDLQALAREISRRGWLTAFQIKEIFKGRGRDLVIDRYVLRDLLGEGGMGRVYRARDTRMGRDVAVKIIRQDRLAHPAAAGRFKHEIEALAKMARHPNVIEVFDADLGGATHYYAMELIDGTDLTKMVRDRGVLNVPEACDYIRQAALGLQHAFEAGLVHRDIKPSNIIVSRDGRSVKLVDLGLARLMENEKAAGGDDGHRITQEGFVIGTPDFLAPEQARNPMVVDIRADIYALGGTLYYILTGKVPYDGANPTEKLIKHCTEPPPSLLPHRPDAPPPVDQIIQWCMAKAPEGRPQTPLQLALALQPFCPPAPPGQVSGRFPVAGTGRHAMLPGTGTHVPLPAGSGPHAPVPAPPAPAPAYPYPAPPPVFPPAAPAPEADRSSQIFKLPPRAASDSPIRRRARGGFPWAFVLVGLGVLLVALLLGWAAYVQFLRPNDSPPDAFTNSTGLKMVKVPGGKFQMGSPEGEPGRRPDEGPRHDVTITGPLLISATEVTNSQYLKVMGANPSRSGNLAHKSHNLPVESVTWDEANEFCKKLTEQERRQPWARKGWAYRLPTEAEWEYACRAGTDGPFAFGPRVAFGRQALFRPNPDDPDLLGVGGEVGRPPQLPQEVGVAEANAFGLHDMHGNVAEWCSDLYIRVYPEGPAVDPTGPTSGDARVIRGGSFKDPPAALRSAARTGARPQERRDDVGFRVVYAPAGK
jgi:formylglycine-generating enzyme required for sulfatase activity/tRNA A-37 threonylcarbamoyl transferase component Bud32